MDEILIINLKQQVRMKYKSVLLVKVAETISWIRWHKKFLRTHIEYIILYSEREMHASFVLINRKAKQVGVFADWTDDRMKKSFNSIQLK